MMSASSLHAYTRLPPSPMERLQRALKWPLIAALATLCLYLVFSIYLTGQVWWAMGALTLFSAGFFTYVSSVGFAYRYLFPGIAGMALFVAFPLVYTAQIGFTNYSSAHLLSVERVRAYLLDQGEPVADSITPFTLHADGAEFRLALHPVDADTSDSQARWISPPLALRTVKPALKVDMQDASAASVALSPKLSLKEVLTHRESLMQLELTTPDGKRLKYYGVGEFASIQPTWQANPDGSMTHLATQITYAANTATGYFESAAGESIQPGFKTGVGLRNYLRMVTDADLRAPFLSIFVWTVVFSALTVLFSTALGMLLAVLLNWEDLRFRTAYRTLLFLPYAVPGFISILVFKGLFNQNFGEINAILDALFGVKPAWFADPMLAKLMLLLVNTWLGYPYIMILCSGLLKSISADLYEASAIAGAGPLTNFFKITMPLVSKPLLPLLISAFAFNFNNFVLIALLTDGRPDFLNTKIPAGQTDILVSYTYRIAFRDSGTEFGLAAAISTLIFFMVAAMSLINLRLMRRSQT